MKFTELPLSEQVLKGVTSTGFTECTEVQQLVLPVSLTQKDVMIQSKTGSGKTAVYVLTILENYVKAVKEGKSRPKALIVAPTRELAVQIEEDTLKLSEHIPGISVGCFYGGVGYAKQDKAIEDGCDIFVCTPGRILDYQKMHKIDFRNFDIFVVDEADRLFDMGFYPDIQNMFSLLRPCTERQTMLFSATLGTKVKNLAWSFMNNPVEIQVQPEEMTVKAITQELYHISKKDKFGLLLQLFLARENPENCLVFTNTKARCIEVAKRLTLNGYAAKYLMGDLPQAKRLETIDSMKDGKIKFLVATDVAARGLQIDDLELVVNYDIPDDFESYVHRIGRTARAGKSGKSITLADEEYVFGLEPIENFINMKIPVIWPAEGELPEVEDKRRKYSFRDLVRNDEYSRSPSPGGARGRGGKRPAPGARRAPAPRRDGAQPRRDSSPRPPRTAQGSRPAPAPRVGAQQARRPSSQEHAGRRSGSKSYAEIQKLSLEERMSYYKQQYSNESGSPVKGAPNKPAQNRGEAKKPVQPQGEIRKSEPRKIQQSRPAQNRSAQSKNEPRKRAPAEATAPISEPVVRKEESKPGFFARMFRKKK